MVEKWWKNGDSLLKLFACIALYPKIAKVRTFAWAVRGFAGGRGRAGGRGGAGSRRRPTPTGRAPRLLAARPRLGGTHATAVGVGAGRAPVRSVPVSRR